jgi:hypothetical protein
MIHHLIWVYFFWSNCIICVSCIICTNCIISTYCLNSPNISTFSKLSPSIIKSNWNKFAPLDVDAAVSDDAIRQTRRRPTWTKRQTTCLIDRSFAPHQRFQHTCFSSQCCRSRVSDVVTEEVNCLSHDSPLPIPSKLSSPCALCCLPSQSLGTANLVSVFIARQQQGEKAQLRHYQQERSSSQFLSIILDVAINDASRL